MKKEELKKINEFMEKWRDHFYHEVDGCESNADNMLYDWSKLEKEFANSVKDEVKE